MANSISLSVERAGQPPTNDVGIRLKNEPRYGLTLLLVELFVGHKCLAASRYGANSNVTIAASGKKNPKAR